MAEAALSPSYYKRGKAPVWDFIRDQGLNFHLGNSIKYICRYGHKGDYNAQVSDLKKAIHYLNDELNHLERSRNREDIPGYNTSNSFISSSEGVPGSLQHIEFELQASTFQAAQPYSGGVQGIFGGGRDVISFES